MKALVIVHSYHHLNTAKVAEAMAKVLAAKVVSTENAADETLAAYDIIGFGAGIDSGRHYAPLIRFAEKLPVVSGKKAFIFSTSAIVGEEKLQSDHAALRTVLLSKGYEILDEFHCRGFNTNSFLKVLGGMNKGRPNDSDLKAAAIFAEALKKRMA
ncbi:flavodoxin family protein [Fusibacter paucivorans]|uniref:Flavodoxin family protein n=1 Tax=Fusibacter paucivorans TaxID=76009 RepID=A0ABS5PKJ0_9FIRM|nr:flavodoxin family protein [Fusibacter paucivorans]MBS7525536.1 flavodoxin family protein [Fusibacter paucivorans]